MKIVLFVWIYYVLLIIVWIPGLLVPTHFKKECYFTWIYGILLAVSSLRGYDVGGDLERYLPLFDEVARHSWDNIFTTYDKYGIIFKLYIKCSSLVCDDSSWYLFTTSAFNLGIPLYFIYRYSKIPWLSIFLYIALGYYTNTFNSVRSSMSLACGMLGVMYLIKERRGMALVWFLIAIEIHKTIFPILILFWLRNMNPTFWRLVLPILGSCVVASVFGLAGFIDILAFYNTFSGYGDAAMDAFGGGQGYSLLALDIVLVFGCYWIIRRKRNGLDSFLLMIVLLGTILQAGAPLYSLVTRIAFFFTIYNVALVPNVLQDGFVRDSRRICISVVWLLCLLYFKVLVMTPTPDFKSNSQGTIPYYFYWERKPQL